MKIPDVVISVLLGIVAGTILALVIIGYCILTILVFSNTVFNGVEPLVLPGLVVIIFVLYHAGRIVKFGLSRSCKSCK